MSVVVKLVVYNSMQAQWLGMMQLAEAGNEAAPRAIRASRASSRALTADQKRTTSCKQLDIGLGKALCKE